jgi:hypothetical protein
LVVAGGEDDGGSVVPNEALRDAGVAEVLKGSAALLQDGVCNDPGKSASHICAITPK